MEIIDFNRNIILAKYPIKFSTIYIKKQKTYPTLGHSLNPYGFQTLSILYLVLTYLLYRALRGLLRAFFIGCDNTIVLDCFLRFIDYRP